MVSVFGDGFLVLVLLTLMDLVDESDLVEVSSTQFRMMMVRGEGGISWGGWVFVLYGRGDDSISA